MKQIAKEARKLKAQEAPAKKTTATGSILSTVAGALAGAIPMFGKYVSPIAAEVGKKAGDALQNFITGHGDYQVQQNSILDASKLPLEVRNDPAKWTVLRKREYLGNVFSAAEAGAFAVTDYSFNIGLPETCPWGSKSGQAFREWLASGAIVEFESTTSPIAPSGGSNLGSVIGAVEYNSSLTHPFTSEDQMENQEHSVSRATSESWILPIECARDETVMADGLWVRAGSLPAGQPAQLYDLCVFSIGTVGQAMGSVNLGKLYLTYEVYVRKATLLETGSAIPADLFILSTPSYEDPFSSTGDNLSTACPGNTLLGELDTTTPGQYNFNPDAPTGDYLVRYYAAELTATASGGLTVGIGLTDNVQLCTSNEGDGGLPIIPNAYAISQAMFGQSLQFATDGQALVMSFRLRLLSRAAGTYFQVVVNGSDFTSAGGGSLLITAIDPNLLFSQPTPPLMRRRVVHYDKSMQHHIDCLESAETRDEVAASVKQFKEFLAHQRLRCRSQDIKKYVSKPLQEKLEKMNYGEDKPVDIDNLVSLARSIIVMGAPRASTATTISRNDPTDAELAALRCLLAGIPQTSAT